MSPHDKTQPTPVGDTAREVLAGIAKKRKAPPRCPACKSTDCRVLDTQELAEVKGVSYKTAQLMLASGKIPHERIGGRFYRTRECWIVEAERRNRTGGRAA